MIFSYRIHDTTATPSFVVHCFQNIQNMNDSERLLLLPDRQGQEDYQEQEEHLYPSISLNSFRGSIDITQWLRQEWPILRVLVSAFL